MARLCSRSSRKLAEKKTCGLRLDVASALLIMPLLSCMKAASGVDSLAQDMPGKSYIAIDLKSFYASVECSSVANERSFSV
ncbi:MAG: hypothetical protein II206_03315 [Bacteroidaceae bacterium]|nr:hypothetical protein [Bacteroidaceae bacterium]